MTENVTWAYTCMNVSFFETTLTWLPPEPWPWLREMLVITHRDHPQLEASLAEAAARIRPLWPIRIVNDSAAWEYSKTLPRGLHKYTSESLGVKLLLPLFVSAPFFFTDDDVVVMRDPGSMMTPSFAWWSQSGLDSYGDSAQDHRDLEALSNAFGHTVPIPKETFNVWRTDAAVWYMPAADRSEYVKRLVSFFSDPVIDEVMHSGKKQRPRLMDQRFLTMWFLQRGAPVKSPHYRAYAGKEPPKAFPKDLTFLHYCASSHKDKYVEWLMKKENT